MLVLYVAVGVATALFTPQVQAFIGDVVPFAKRGTAIGFVELSWALGWIVGVPLFGFLIARASWWSSFLVFGAIGLLGLVLVLRFAIKPPTLNPQGLSQTATDARRDPEGLAHLDVDSIRRVLRNGPAIRMLLFSLLIIFSAQLATQVYAPHLLQTFNLDVVQLGLVSIVLGVADIVAEVGTIVLVDRVGKRRSVLISCVLFAAACLLVIVGRDALWPIMAALFLVFLAFEFCIVASLAMKSEVAPDARTTMIGFTVAASSLGRIIGSAIALPLFALGGLTPVMLVASGFTALAAVVCWPVRVGE